MRIPRVSRGISALKNGKRREGRGTVEGRSGGRLGEREWGKGQLYLKGRWEEYIYIMILAVHLRFFFPFFVSRCGNAESSSRFDPTRIVLVYENRSTNIERISLEISALRKSYVFFYVYVYVYVTRLASPRHAAKTLTFCTGDDCF